MNMHSQPNDPSEHGLHRLLRSLPDRNAPATLEARVFAEIARRAALPWYRQPYARWPLAIRVAFLILSAAAAAVLIFGLAQLLNVIPEQVEKSHFMTWGVGVWRSFFEYCGRTIATIPQSVFTLILVGIAACYTALFGLGAATYRYLWKV